MPATSLSALASTAGMLFSPLFHRWKAEAEEGNILPKVIESVSGETEIYTRTVGSRVCALLTFRATWSLGSLTPGPVLLVLGLSMQGIEETLNTGVT